MQSVLMTSCFICKLSLWYSALCEKCPYYLVLYMQSVFIIQWFVCEVSLLSSALHAKCLYYAVLYMRRVSLLSGALHTKYHVYWVLLYIMRSVLALYAKWGGMLDAPANSSTSKSTIVSMTERHSVSGDCVPYTCKALNDTESHLTHDTELHTKY